LAGAVATGDRVAGARSIMERIRTVSDRPITPRTPARPLGTRTGDELAK